MSATSVNLLRFCCVLAQEPSSSSIPPAIGEAVSQDGRKRRSTLEPASERGSDKRRRICYHGEDCELTIKVSAQESTIRNLAGVVEDLLGRLAALEGQPPSAISIDYTRTESSKHQRSCPADNCTKAFDRTDHLHRHIRGVGEYQAQLEEKRLDDILRDEKYSSIRERWAKVRMTADNGRFRREMEEARRKQSRPGELKPATIAEQKKQDEIRETWGNLRADAEARRQISPETRQQPCSHSVLGLLRWKGKGRCNMCKVTMKKHLFRCADCGFVACRQCKTGS